MMINMDDTDAEAFREFVQRHWGVILNDRGEIISRQQ